MQLECSQLIVLILFRCVRRRDWLAKSLIDQQQTLPCKRSRTQTSTSPDFVTGDRLEKIDEMLIQPDLTYAYSLPLHMGGKRRTIRKELLEEQATIVDMMRKFPLGSLIKKRFPNTTTSASATATTRARPVSQQSNATSTPQASVTITTITPTHVVVNSQTPAATPATTTTVTVAREVPKPSPAKRRRQIQFAYELLGTPPELVTPQGGGEPINQWSGKDGVIQLIADYLLWAQTWRTKAMIKRVLQFMQEKIENGHDLANIDAGVKIGAHRSGRKKILTPELGCQMFAARLRS